MFKEEGQHLADKYRGVEIAASNQKMHYSLVLQDVGLKPFAMLVLSLVFIKILPIFLMLVGASFFITWRRLRKKLQLFRYMPKAKIADLQPGFYEITGEVELRNQPLDSWFTKTKCLAYTARIDKKSGKRKKETSHLRKLLLSGKRAKVFLNSCYTIKVVSYCQLLWIRFLLGCDGSF